jgi:hypothetical protein
LEKVRINKKNCLLKGDTLILAESSRKLTEYFPNPMVVEHDGGHYIPVTSAPKQAYKQFLEPFLK